MLNTNTYAACQNFTNGEKCQNNAKLHHPIIVGISSETDLRVVILLTDLNKHRYLYVQVFLRFYGGELCWRVYIHFLFTL